MVQPADLERFRQANAGLSKLVRDALEAFFRSLDLSRPEAARDALLGFVPVLVARYGDVTATIAADFYEEMRASSGAPGRFTAVTAAAVAPGPVEAKVRFLAGHLWTPTPDLMLGGLLTAADKYVKQPGRNTIAQNAHREGVRWARVPTGAKTCAFCLMLAGRTGQWLYKSERSAIYDANGEKYHGDCDCQPIRVTSEADYPEGFDPHEAFRMYDTAREASGSGDIKDIAAKMREIYADHLTDGHVTHQ